MTALPRNAQTDVEPKSTSAGGETSVRIHIIEDDVSLCTVLEGALRHYGYLTDTSSTLSQAMDTVTQRSYDCIILDLSLPDGEGSQFVEYLRRSTQTPILVLTARDRLDDKIALLDAGANDYVTKPFALGELLARLRVLTRSSHAYQRPDVSVYKFGTVVLNSSHGSVTRDGTPIRLTPIEFRVLVLLAEAGGSVVSQRQILEAVWGASYSDATEILRVHIQHLRRKIENNPSTPAYLLTVLGVGYRLQVD